VIGSSLTRIGVSSTATALDSLGAGAGTGRAAGLRTRLRSGLRAAICVVFCSGVLRCATRGGKSISALALSLRGLVMPRGLLAATSGGAAGTAGTAGTAGSPGAAGSVLSLVWRSAGLVLLKICTTMDWITRCTGQYRLAIHSSSRCARITTAIATRRWRGGRPSGGEGARAGAWGVLECGVIRASGDMFA
jgi:hypothetical protein